MENLERHKGGVAREWIESIIIALMLALIIRFFIFELYKIPSASMEPTLIGDEDWAVQNRILVFKFPYRFHFIEPDRWDVIVFKYPEDPSINYIKRLIAFPGEHVQILNGDIFIDGAVAQKPAHVQQSLRNPVYRNDFSAVDKKLRWWRAPEQGWEIKNGQLVADTAGETSMVMTHQVTNMYFRIPGKDFSYEEYANHMCDSCGFVFEAPPTVLEYEIACPRCNYVWSAIPPLSTNYHHLVSDLAFATDLIIDKAQTVVRITQQKDEHKFIYRLQPGKKIGFESLLTNTREIIDFIPEVGTVYNVEVSFFDGVCRLLVDGDEVFKKDMGFTPQRIVQATQGWFSLGIANGRARFDNFALDRDIFYVTMASWSNVYVDKESYYALGDNSANSRDSRYWKFIPKDNLLGKALTVIWPFSDIKIID